ncbi:acetoacetate metabolism regulatory protein AtoC [Hydrogenophilus thermoluteolus]|uniref:sigma-54-dependent transcriptional regulator n=1 Tax=Hydrogenophilus thermoluteolus TaxID=297 RepID=UPI0024A0F4F1|nr:sigma-54 dependent transcriptional regulator [Hydrogenophilus thermoluteolus]GLW60683.1 acetoacetate metabolism regulatory protein AtoC [Hydrogenophilus thermoluteolus]
MPCQADAKPRLALIEDDPIMGESLTQLLTLEGFDVTWFQNGKTAQDGLRTQRFCVVVCDIRLPDIDGGDLFLTLSAERSDLPPFLLLTAYGTIDRAVELIKAGAADYLTKPFEVEALLHRVRELAESYGIVREETDDTLGISPAMHRIAEQLPRLARHAEVLLITGESGCGKEYVARRFHHHAVGSEGAFVAVNCAAIPESLIEAELFGYEKGAFTGATRTKKGLFELADGGTLFLDEIGEMSLAMQAKLLRVLQDHRFTRLGGEKPLTSRFRLVCATHCDLKAMVEAGTFREDLYYRIHVIHLRIPPLRERPEDIRWFLRRFIAEFNQQHPDERKRIDPRAEAALLSYAWPGNIRELKHAVERACILAPGPTLTIDAFFDHDAHAPELAEEETKISASLAEYLMACEREYLKRALEQNQGHITRTAAALGITRKTLWGKLKKLERLQGQHDVTHS